VEKIQIFKRFVNPSHLNTYGTLHGGWLLQWTDEAAAITAAELTGKTCVTRFISEVSFESTAESGDIVEINVRLVKTGTTSLTFHCEALNFRTRKLMAVVEKMIFVSLDKQGRPTPHGLSREPA